MCAAPHRLLPHQHTHTPSMETGLYLNLSSAPHWWHVNRLFPSIATPAVRDGGIIDVSVDGTFFTIGVSCCGRSDVMGGVVDRSPRWI